MVRRSFLSLALGAVAAWFAPRQALPPLIDKYPTLLGQLQPGEACVFGPSGQTLRMKPDCSIQITLDDGGGFVVCERQYPALFLAPTKNPGAYRTLPYVVVTRGAAAEAIVYRYVNQIVPADLADKKRASQAAGRPDVQSRSGRWCKRSPS